MNMNKKFLVALLISITTFSFAASLEGATERVQGQQQKDVIHAVEDTASRVTEAVQQGLIKPYSELYKKIEIDLYGRVIEVNLEEDDSQWTYEIKLIHNNQIVEIEYDATTLTITEIEARDVLSVIKGLK